MLNTCAEPPPNAIFILSTTENHIVLPTILSRCQIYDFNRININDIAKQLAGIAEKEGITAEPDALHVIVEKADVAMRDALSIFDRIVSFCDNNITYDGVVKNLNILDYDYYFKAIDHIQEQSHKDLLLLLDEIIENGFEPRDFMAGLTEDFRNLPVCQTPGTGKVLENSGNVKGKY